MKYRITLYMEDHEQGSWNRTETFTAKNADEAETKATNYAIEELPFDGRSKSPFATHVRVQFESGDYNRSIDVKGSQLSPDITIW